MDSKWWQVINDCKLTRELFPNWNGLAMLGLHVGAIEAVAKIEEVIASVSYSQIHPSAKIDPGAKIINSIICKDVEIYEGVTIRDSIILEGTTVGHCSEVARSVIMERCFIPRFNYVGGSLLGTGTNLGGVATFATRRHDNSPIVLAWGEERIETGQWKFGSIVGEGCTIAFSSHVNPGTVIGQNSLIMPYVDLRGYTPPNSVVFVKQKMIESTHRSILDLELLRKRWS